VKRWTAQFVGQPAGHLVPCWSLGAGGPRLADESKRTPKEGKCAPLAPPCSTWLSDGCGRAAAPTRTGPTRPQVRLVNASAGIDARVFSHRGWPCAWPADRREVHLQQSLLADVSVGLHLASQGTGDRRDSPSCRLSGTREGCISFARSARGFLTYVAPSPCSKTLEEGGGAGTEPSGAESWASPGSLHCYIAPSHPRGTAPPTSPPSNKLDSNG
jgi:hypothetical protein